MNNNFFIVLSHSRKKVDKYLKINRIRNKYIIDIKKIMEDEELTLEDTQSMQFFKILIYKKFQLAKHKHKDIYYLPNLDNPDLNIEKLLKMRDLVSDYKFNLLVFYNEFKHDELNQDILDCLHAFDSSAVLEDY